MTIHRQNIGRTTEGRPVSWESKDALLYALSVGAGASRPAEELAYTTENSRSVDQRVLQTFAVVLGGSGGSMRDLGDFALSQILHGGQSVTLHDDLPVSGTVVPVSAMTAVHDKGKHAVIELTTDLLDAATREPVATTVTTMIVRGEGGFGGDPGPASTWDAPDRPADITVSEPTSPGQALLYRLNGDRNPLHSDPKFAARAGFERPILHGLCTYGMTGRALLMSAMDGDVGRFRAMAGRFSSPVLPGDELTVRIWRQDDENVVFRTLRGDGTVVIDRGRAEVGAPR